MATTLRTSERCCSSDVYGHIRAIRYWRRICVSFTRGPIIRQMGGVYADLGDAQGVEMWVTQLQIGCVEPHRYHFPKRADRLSEVMWKGVTSKYIGCPPTPPMTRGLPYRAKDSDNSDLIVSKLRSGLRQEECSYVQPTPFR